MRHFWLDRIIQLEPGARATGLKAVALAEDHFDAHFPGNPVLPGVCLLEGLAQTAGVLIHESVDRRLLAIMVSLDRARFPAFDRPGDQVRLEAEIESRARARDRQRPHPRVGALQLHAGATRSPDSRRLPGSVAADDRHLAGPLPRA